MGDLVRLESALKGLKPNGNKPGRKPPLSDAEWRAIFKSRRSGVSLKQIYVALTENYVEDGVFFYSTFLSFKQAATREKLRLRLEKKDRRLKIKQRKDAKRILTELGFDPEKCMVQE